MESILEEEIKEFWGPNDPHLQLLLLDRRFFLRFHSTRMHMLHRQKLDGEPVMQCRRKEGLCMIELLKYGGGDNDDKLI